MDDEGLTAEHAEEVWQLNLGIPQVFPAILAGSAVKGFPP